MTNKLVSRLKSLYHIFAFRLLSFHDISYRPYHHAISLFAGSQHADISFVFEPLDHSKYLVVFQGDSIVYDKRAMKRIIKIMRNNKLPNCDNDLQLSWLYKDFTTFNPCCVFPTQAYFGHLKYVGPSNYWTCPFYPPLDIYDL